jgi:hypothetical protein
MPLTTDEKLLALSRAPAKGQSARCGRSGGIEKTSLISLTSE